VKIVKKIFKNLVLVPPGAPSAVAPRAGLVSRFRISTFNFFRKIKFKYFLPFFVVISILVSVALFSYYYVLPMYYSLLKEHHEIKVLKNKIRIDYEKTQILKIITSFHSGLPLAEEKNISDLIFNIGKKYAINPALILAVIRVESSFNNFSYSDMGAVGLMQVKPITGLYLIKKYKIKSKEFNYNTKHIEYLPVNYLYNPSLNIRIGARYLLSLLYEFKNLKLALFAYNAGPTVIFKTINSNQLNLKEEGSILNKLESTNQLFSDFYYGYYKRIKKYFKDYNKKIFKNDGNLKVSWKHKSLLDNSNDKYSKGGKPAQVHVAPINYNPVLVEK